MLIVKPSEVNVRLPKIVRRAIKYIDDNHSNIDFGSFILPKTSLKIIKLQYKTASTTDSYIYENHHLVDDIHYIKEGSEYVSVVEPRHCKEVEPYNNVLDYQIFTTVEASFVKLNTGDVAIFSKQELHLTGVNNCAVAVVKYVIKHEY